MAASALGADGDLAGGAVEDLGPAAVLPGVDGGGAAGGAAFPRGLKLDEEGGAVEAETGGGAEDEGFVAAGSGGGEVVGDEEACGGV